MFGSIFGGVKIDSRNCFFHWNILVPECFSSQLQMFSFINYGGNESELQFTKYIIQNATVLRSIKIYRNTSSNLPEEQRQMIKELFLCQRGSVLRQPHFEWISGICFIQSGCFYSFYLNLNYSYL